MEDRDIGTARLFFLQALLILPGRGTSADERGQEPPRGKPWARPDIPTSIVDISCQRPVLKLQIPGDTAVTLTSVTARWPIVKGVLSK